MLLTYKYPPTSETMIAIPPTDREWKALNHQQIDLQQVTPPFNHLPQAIMVSSSLSNNREKGGESIAAITFRTDCDDMLDVSVTIKDTSSSNLTMTEVIQEGGVFKKFGFINGGNRWI